MAVFENWKNITDKMYSGELNAEQGTTHLIELLKEEGIGLRSSDHRLLGISFFVYDKGEYAIKENKSLGLGLVYMKPNKTKTQDIFFVASGCKIEKFYSEKEMIKKYSWMKDTHKKDLPL